MKRLRAWALAVDGVMSPVVDPIERAMRWLQARWYRLVALGAIEAVVFGVLIWSPW